MNVILYELIKEIQCRADSYRDKDYLDEDYYVGKSDGLEEAIEIIEQLI